jgi:hypothetical protein
MNRNKIEVFIYLMEKRAPHEMVDPTRVPFLSWSAARTLLTELIRLDPQFLNKLKANENKLLAWYNERLWEKYEDWKQKYLNCKRQMKSYMNELNQSIWYEENKYEYRGSDDSGSESSAESGPYNKLNRVEDAYEKLEDSICKDEPELSIDSLASIKRAQMLSTEYDRNLKRISSFLKFLSDETEEPWIEEEYFTVDSMMDALQMFTEELIAVENEELNGSNGNQSDEMKNARTEQAVRTALTKKWNEISKKIDELTQVLQFLHSFNNLLLAHD